MGCYLAARLSLQIALPLATSTTVFSYEGGQLFPSLVSMKGTALADILSELQNIS